VERNYFIGLKRGPSLVKPLLVFQGLLGFLFKASLFLITRVSFTKASPNFNLKEFLVEARN